MTRVWTNEEIETMAEILMSGKSLKRNMHRLPGRSYSAASTKCLDAGIRYPKVIERVSDLMEDGKQRTAMEIAKLLSIPRKRVADALRHAVRPGDRQSMHVCGMSANRKHLLFVIGEGVNFNASPEEIAKQIEADDEREQDRRYRSQAKWWPRADVVVVEAMNAMVHAGRTAA